jgi:hypothetical protein
MKIKDILIAVGIIAVALALTPRSETAAPHDAEPNGVATTPRTPYPCESDHSIRCTWGQHQQIAEEDCAKYRAQGGQCEIVTNGRPPHAVRIPSDSERADMHRKIDEGARRLCDNLANAGYDCPSNSN